METLAVVRNIPTAALSHKVTVTNPNNAAGRCLEKFKKYVQDLTTELEFLNEATEHSANTEATTVLHSYKY